MLQKNKKENDLIRRMKLMTRTYKIEKKPKWKAAALVAVMILVSTGSVSAATVAVGEAYLKAYNATVVDEEELDKFEELYGIFEEFEETGDFPEGVTVTIGEVNTKARSDPSFYWTISASRATKTSNFSATSDNTIVVTAVATSSSATFRAGIIEPDGTRRYVNSSKGVATHSFELDQNGKYSVYVQNTGSSAITVNGTYTVQD